MAMAMPWPMPMAMAMAAAMPMLARFRRAVKKMSIEFRIDNYREKALF